MQQQTIITVDLAGSFPAAGRMPARLRIARDLAAFADLWPRSDRRGGTEAYVFQYADVLSLWLTTVGAARGVDPYFMVLDDAAGEPLIGLALGIERRRGLKLLTFLDGGVSDYNAPVVFGPADGPLRLLQVLTARLREVLPAFDIALFDKMPAEVGRSRNPLIHDGIATHPPFGHLIRLTGTWEEFAATRLPRAQDIRRKRRKLEASGDVRFVVAGDAADRARILDAMIRQKTQRYVATRGEDGFDRPGYRAYYPEVTRVLGPGGVAHLSAITVDDHIIASHWGLVAGKTFYILMLGYDPAWSRFSPGRLLNERLIAWSFANGIDCVDFGVGDESYKFEICNETRRLHRVVIPVTLAGSAGVVAFNAKRELEKTRAWAWLMARRGGAASARAQS